MITDELKKEAEEWLNKWELCNKCDHKVQCVEDNAFCPQVVERAYLASAEPREKRIAELEAQIEKMKCCQNCSHLCGLCELGISGCYVCSKWKLRR